MLILQNFKIETIGLTTPICKRLKTGINIDGILRISN